MQIPLDPNIKDILDIPTTISFTVRKRMQIDSFGELPKDKRPPEMMIWDKDSEEIEKWLDRVFNRKGSQPDKIELVIRDSEIG